MASYGGVSTSTSLGRPFLSGHSPEQPGLGPMGQPQQQWSRAIPQGVQLPYTQGTSEIPMEKPVTGVFKGASPQLGSNSCSSYGSTSVCSIGSFFTARAAVGCYGPLLGYQVEPSELAPTKPISLGLTNFQQAKPEKEANLPLSPSPEAWLTCQAITLEGKRPAWESLKPTLGQKSYPKLPSSRAELFGPSNAPSLLRVGQLPPEWHRLVSDQGRISPETVSFTG